MKRFLNKRVDTQRNNVQGRFRILTTALLMLFVFTSQLYATPNVTIIQQQEIKGTVTGADNSPLPGVSILVVGTTNGAETDFDGNYSINANKGDVLQFSFVGMKTQTVTVGDDTTINITLADDASALDEVVVIGYGTRKKKDLTGAVSVISSEELTREVKMSPELSMQGKMAGINISNPGANPNARPEIRIRGVGTLGFNDPLYVIDGVPVIEGLSASELAFADDVRGGVNIMNLINPNDIESISVLKDASATAIYGVRASNGVILIQTKRGRKGKTKVTFSQSYGVQSLNKSYDVLNTQQYVDIHNEAWANNPDFGREKDEKFGSFYDPSSPNYLGNNPTYSSIDDAVNSAAVQDYNIGISGGSDVSNFAVGIGYAKQESVIFSTDFERYSFSINSDHKVTKWLKLGQSFRMALSRTEKEDQLVEDSFFRTTTLASPWQPFLDSSADGFASTGRNVIDGDGNTIYNELGYGNSTRANFLGRALYTNNRRTILRNLGSFYAEITPLKNLRLRGTLGIDHFSNGRETLLLPKNGLYNPTIGSVVDVTGSNFGIRRTENLNITTEFLIGYINSFGKHNFDLVLNAMDQKTHFNLEATGAKGTGITSWDQRRIKEGEHNGGTFKTRRGLIGYMGRLGYNFDSKYYVDATIRRDGSSIFGDGYKWGTFRAIGLAWRLSSEKFMENSTLFDDLKFRAGWGETGNQETRPFNYLSLINDNPAYALGPSVEGNGTIHSGIALGDFPILDTTWETSTTTNVGFDATLLDNRLNVTLEYYNRDTEGILQAIDIPQVIGALSKPVVNLATVENKGIEFQIGFNDKFGDIGFNASFNLTTVNNNVTKLYNDRPQGNDFNRIEVGYSLGYLYGYKTDGIFQTPAEVADWLATNSYGAFSTSQLAPGDFKYQDLHGQPTDADGPNAYRSIGPDNVIDNLDKTYLGKTIPGYFYGLSLGLDYKGFDFGLTFRGLGDVQKVNWEKMAGESLGTGGGNFFTTVNDRWTPTNASNTMPRTISQDPSGNNRFSDRWVEDASFFRLQNVQLGYTFGDNIIEKMHASNLRIHAGFSNAFVISSYSGLDPENDTTPTTFTVGFNIGF